MELESKISDLLETRNIQSRLLNKTVDKYAVRASVEIIFVWCHIRIIFPFFFEKKVERERGEVANHSQHILFWLEIIIFQFLNGVYLDFKIKIKYLEE